MKIEINQIEIVNALEIAVAISNKKQTHHILENVLLELDKSNVLKIRATDLQVFFQKCIKLTAIDLMPGKICLSAKHLLGIVKGYNYGEIIIEQVEKEVHIYSPGSKARYKLNIVDAADFPEMPEIDQSDKQSVELSQVIFKKMLKAVSYAQAKEQTRYFLNGVFLSNADSDNVCSFVSTDSRRLAINQYETENNFADTVSVIIPTETINLILQLLHDLTFQLTISSGKMFIEFENIFFSTSLIDGNFPDYTKVMPDIGNPIILNLQELKTKLERVSVVEHISNLIIFHIDYDKNKIILKRITDYGQAVDEIDFVETIDQAGQLELGLNGKYLADCLKVLHGEKINFYATNSSSPVVLYGNAEYGKHVIMPMKVK